jgi:hypothetical protein
MVVLDITDITPEILTEFREFLRQNMITPTLKGVDGPSHSREDEKKIVAHFTGCFSERDADRIEDWLNSQEVGLQC